MTDFEIMYAITFDKLLFLANRHKLLKLNHATDIYVLSIVRFWFFFKVFPVSMPSTVTTKVYPYRKWNQAINCTFSQFSTLNHQIKILQ